MRSIDTDTYCADYGAQCEEPNVEYPIRCVAGRCHRDATTVRGYCAQHDKLRPHRCADGDHTFDVAESYATLSVRPCIVCGMRPTQADIDAILSDPNTRGA